MSNHRLLMRRHDLKKTKNISDNVYISANWEHELISIIFFLTNIEWHYTAFTIIAMFFLQCWRWHVWASQLPTPLFCKHFPHSTALSRVTTELYSSSYFWCVDDSCLHSKAFLGSGFWQQWMYLSLSQMPRPRMPDSHPSCRQSAAM